MIVAEASDAAFKLSQSGGGGLEVAARTRSDGAGVLVSHGEANCTNSE